MIALIYSPVRWLQPQGCNRLSLSLILTLTAREHRLYWKQWIGKNQVK